MEFIADLHIHSRYSRATAKNLDLENLFVAARKKGLAVVATGDFTHPAWFAELQEKLVPAESGLFKLRSELVEACERRIPSACQGEVRFLLETEISNIYKKKERTRKNHNLVYMPDLESARKFNLRLEQVGNIHSDGRPILGLDARDLLEIVLETAPDARLIPAHVWTPWFSVLGSKSGFDSVKACFGDLSDHIFALETGLSSDPPMNWRISDLDAYALVSNSDAHSPAKLAREANCFDTEFSYQAIFEALTQRGDGRFKGTIEFYPEEGKYHLDGHRKCGVQLTPKETRIYDGRCPVCGKALVLGVLHRVEALADRDPGFRPPSGEDFVHLVPLEDILAQLLRVGPKSKKVTAAQDQLLETLGPELGILRDQPLEAFNASKIPHLGEAIRRMRHREIRFSPGYDGEYGRLQLFSPDEWQELGGQRRLFDIPDSLDPVELGVNVALEGEFEPSGPDIEDYGRLVSRVLKVLDGVSNTGVVGTPSQRINLNPEQQQVVDHDGGPLIVVAGPGTGKTRVLTERIVHLVNSSSVPGERILAVTFTQKAAAEMNERLDGRLAVDTQRPLVATFHSLCLQLLKEGNPFTTASPEVKKTPSIVSGDRQLTLVADAIALATATGKDIASLKPRAAQEAISAVKQGLLPPEAPRADLIAAAGGMEIAAVYAAYQRLLDNLGAWDYDDLIFKVVMRLEKDQAYRQACRERFTHLFVDEYQDLNASQYRIVRALCPPASQLCVIGDPDQAIYGFRGAQMAYFNNFLEDYPNARVVHLRRNYRSVQSVLTAAFGVIKDQHINLLGEEDDRPLAQIPGNPQIFELTGATERSEAVAIGKTIEQMVGGTGFHHLDFGAVKDQARARQLSFGDFAVLYRTHQQGQKLAEQLGRGGIPCQVCSRRQLLGYPAVKALIAVVQLMNNSAAFYDFEAVAEVFKAGIGPKTLEQLKRWSYHKGLGLMEALVASRRVPLPGITLARQQNMFDFIKRLDRLHHHLDPLTLPEQLRYLVEQTPIGALFEADEAATHALTLLMRSATQVTPDRGAFIESLSLLSDSDAYDPRAERVALMTLHAAKGLEFPVVFIAGCEEGFLPYLRNPDKDTADTDEERRLLYVGMTRARYLLFLCRAQKRRIYGRIQVREPSPFLAAIEKGLLAPWEHQAPKKAPPRQQQLGLFE